MLILVFCCFFLKKMFFINCKPPQVLKPQPITLADLRWCDAVVSVLKKDWKYLGSNAYLAMKFTGCHWVSFSL